MTHTPGPWTAHKNPVGTYWPVSAEFGDARACIARVTNDEIPSAQSFDNARLLEALEMILPLAEAYLSGAPSHPDNAKLETARAIIAGCK